MLDSNNSNATTLSQDLRQPLEQQPDDSFLQDDASANDEAPSTGRQILELAIPAAGALLIDPLMTLVDTAFVGKYTLNEQGLPFAAPLAGMASAAALLTFCFYLCNFLCTATTPLVAKQRAAGNTQQAANTGGQALTLALTLGGGLTAFLLLFQQPLLQLMGTDSTGTDANHYALAFLSVRAFAAPAVLCIDASTGVLRGYLDTKTPVVLLIAANIVNLLLDVLLVVHAGQGPLGAAIATTSAEWISALLFLNVLSGNLPSASEWSRSSSSSSSSDMLLDEPRRLNVVPTLAIPPWSDVQPLITASSSIFLRAIVIQSALALAAAVVARSGGVAPASSLAAHQISLQLWMFGSFFLDSLAAAAQGLVADALGRQDPVKVVDVSRTIFAYSLALGLAFGFLLQVGISTEWLLDAFTSDPSTRQALSKIMPLVIAAQPLNALVFAADGILQGATEFSYQARAMAVSGATAVASYFAFASTAYTITGAEQADTLLLVWSALLVLQGMRFVTSMYKLVDEPINLMNRKGT